MIQTILVVGATGMLGKPVVHQLKNAGYRVKILTRSPEKASTLFGADFEVVNGDVESPDSLLPALHGCQGVHINLNGMSDPDLERRGTQNILQAALKLGGMERLTYLSGASVCEENCWYAGTKAKFQAEAAIRDSGIPYTIFRAHYFMETMINLVRKKMAMQIGKQPKPYDWVAASDYANMVVKAYTTPQAAFKTLYVCGPQALTTRQALLIFTHIAHPEARLFYIPLPVAAIIAKLGNRKELQAALPFFDYCEKTRTILSGSPDEANALLGSPSTTLEMWSQAQIGTKTQDW